MNAAPHDTTPTLLDILTGDAAQKRIAEMIGAADKLDAVIDDTKRGLDAWARGKPSWREVLALPENRGGAPNIDPSWFTAAEERQQELLANIYDGEPEFLIAAMQAGVTVASLTMRVVNAARLAPDKGFGELRKLSRRLDAALLEYVAGAA